MRIYTNPSITWSKDTATLKSTASSNLPSDASTSSCFLSEIKENVTQLLNAPPLITHSDRNFIHTNCSASIKNTVWEGANTVKAILYMQELLEHLDLPIKHPLTSAHLQCVKNSLDDLAFFHDLLSSLAQTEHDQVESWPDRIIPHIIERCMQKGCCYLPSGWQAQEGGHHAVLKIRKLNDLEYGLSFLNYGGGAEYHQGSSSTKSRRDYQSEEYIFSIDREGIKEFLCRTTLLKYDHRLRIKSRSTDLMQPPDAKDLYMLLAGCSNKCIQMEERDERLHFVTNQRSGTCPMTNTWAAMRDALVSTGKVPPEVIKRFHYSIKLVSIIEAFKAHQQRDVTVKIADAMEREPLPTEFELFMRDALHELSVRSLKLYPDQISQRELAFANEIIRQITSILDENKMAREADFYAPQAVPSLELATIPPQPPVQEGSDTPSIRPIRKDESTPCFKIRDQIPPSQLVDYLSTAIQFYLSKDERNRPNRVGKVFDDYTDSRPTIQKKLLVLREFMYSLPKTSGKAADSYWDQCIGEGPLILDKLVELIMELPHTSVVDWNSVYAPDESYAVDDKINNRLYYQGYVFEISLIAFDIAAQLAQHLPNLRLGNGFAFALSDIYSFYTATLNIGHGFAIRNRNIRENQYGNWSS